MLGEVLPGHSDEEAARCLGLAGSERLDRHQLAYQTDRQSVTDYKSVKDRRSVRRHRPPVQQSPVQLEA
jgi:hypothetical protein